MYGAGHDVPFRLTKARFRAVARQAVRLDDVARHGTVTRGARSRLARKPSAKDRKSRPNPTADACLDVELHELERAGGEPLYLVTTLGIDGAEAAALYARRYDVEHELRDLKVTRSNSRSSAPRATRWFARNSSAGAAFAVRRTACSAAARKIRRKRHNTPQKRWDSLKSAI